MRFAAFALLVAALASCVKEEVVASDVAPVDSGADNEDGQDDVGTDAPGDAVGDE